MSLTRTTLSAVLVIATLPTSATHAQHTEAVDKASRAFAKAWLTRDAKAVDSFLHPDCSFYSESGGDLSRAKGVLRNLNRTFKGMESSETIVDRQVRASESGAIVVQTSRVDHRGENRSLSIGSRQTQIWVRSNEAWKLAHLHVSPYSNFATAITAFGMADKAEQPKPGGVVFVGSSSIRMWKSLREDFPGTNTVHRGFGGSQLIDSIIYAHHIITPYKPRKVVVYAGDNDVNAGKNAHRVLQDFKTLVATIQARVPNAEVGFIAIKPSRARWNLWPEMDRANKMIAEFAKSHPKVAFLDIATPMLGENGGKPAKDWFIKDGLHMTPKGYALWTDIVRPWVASGK